MYFPLQTLKAQYYIKSRNESPLLFNLLTISNRQSKSVSLQVCLAASCIYTAAVERVGRRVGGAWLHSWGDDGSLSDSKNPRAVSKAARVRQTDISLRQAAGHR